MCIRLLSQELPEISINKTISRIFANKCVKLCHQDEFVTNFLNQYVFIRIEIYTCKI